MEEIAKKENVIFGILLFFKRNTIVFVFYYDFSDNASETMQEYARRFPDRKMQERRVIMLPDQCLTAIHELSIQDALLQEANIE